MTRRSSPPRNLCHVQRVRCIPNNILHKESGTIYFTKGGSVEIGDFLPSESACEERPWKSPSPRADFLKLAGVRVARGSGAFVLKDLLPRYASQCAWVVARLPVHVVTLLKSSELARGVQSPHKDENPSPDMKQVGRVQFACGQMDDDPLQQRTAHIPAEERGEE
jgi:hypothetical protein